MPLISSGRSLRGSKAATPKRTRAKKAVPAGDDAGDSTSTSASSAGTALRPRRAPAKASAEAIAEVQARIARLLETRLLVARTEATIEQLQSQMGAFANNPQMAQRAAAVLEQARSRLQTAQQQLAELEASIPPGVVWDQQTGMVQEVRDTAGLSRSLGSSNGASSQGMRDGGGGGGGSNLSLIQGDGRQGHKRRRARAACCSQRLRI